MPNSYLCPVGQGSLWAVCCTLEEKDMSECYGIIDDLREENEMLRGALEKIRDTKSDLSYGSKAIAEEALKGSND